MCLKKNTINIRINKLLSLNYYEKNINIYFNVALKAQEFGFGTSNTLCTAIDLKKQSENNFVF
ncbi:hypothetical protein BpHYR1_028495 [Brachionus plicatilis]|uniref:Uncharacterized protein n=1 Tax=Brachionus plicatilis TaxID=10195 RepID=A0A3M7T6U4_BRAPC|nr:hypothetical protein BpHYR1_028495 [Brachionus plicatilis]